MANVYTEEQLHQMSSDELIPLFLSLQEKQGEVERTLQIVLEQLADLKRHRFGRSTERLDDIPGQLSIFDHEAGEFCFNEAEMIADASSDESDDSVGEGTAPPKRGTKKKGKRDADLKNLTVRIVPHTLSEEELNAFFGDEAYKKLPDEIQKVIIRIPAQTYIEEHHIEVYSGKESETMIKADHPHKLLRGSLVSSSLMSDSMTEKFVNATPYYRQEQNFEREGIPVTRQDLASWTIKIAKRYLAQIYMLMRLKLFTVHIIHADETPFLVNKDGRPAGVKSYMWVYRTGSMSAGPPVVIYEYQKTRKADHPLEFLKDFKGICVTDGYEVYHSIEKKRQELEIAGCWSHARRRFDEAIKALPKNKRYDTIAGKALSMIKLIFEEESKLKNLTPDERLDIRREKIEPMVNAYFKWLKENRHKVMNGTKTASGIDYCLNQESYLRVFLSDGDVPMHNNPAEQAIRPFCIGKKNWEFCDTPSGAEASAIVYSIIETAKANGLRPFYYLDHVLSVMAEHQKDENKDYLNDLLPWSDKLPKVCYKVVNVQNNNE